MIAPRPSCSGHYAKPGIACIAPAEARNGPVHPTPRHFEYANQNGLVLLTHNYNDFLELHDVVKATRVNITAFSSSAQTMTLRAT